MIKIMADSTCDLSQDLVDKYDISIVPLTITMDDRVYRDKIDISADDFYEIMSSLKKPPTTAMPNPTDYIDVFLKTLNEGNTEILCICMSSGTSGAYSAALMARQQFFEEYPGSPLKIHIVDSKSMSHGSGWLILKSARLREKGASFEELIEFNETYKWRVKHFLAVDDMDHLIRSGRLSNVGAFLGRLFNVKPIMSMKDGRGAIVAKERGRKKVLEHYAREFNRRVDRDMSDFVIIGYTSEIGVARELYAIVREKCDFSGEIFIMQMGAVVGTHVGPGGISMFFVEKSNKGPRQS